MTSRLPGNDASPTPDPSGPPAGETASPAAEPGSDEISRITSLYSTQYARGSEDPSYVWHPLNPVSVYFRQAREKAIIDLLRRTRLPLAELRVLDAGCGGGGLLAFLCSIHADPDKLAGVDLIPSRVQRAARTCPPQVKLAVADAQTLPFEDDSFDLVCQFTVFSSILEDQIRRRLVSEMQRVLAPGGHLLWYDLTGGRAAETRGIPPEEVSRLLPGFTVLDSRSLHPLGAIRLARHSRLLCQLLDVLPFVPKTNYMALLRGPGASG